MSEISKALDKSHEVTALEKRGGHRLRNLDIIRPRSKRRLACIIATACIGLSALGSILIQPAQETRRLRTAGAPAAVQDPLLMNQLDELIVNVMAQGASPRIMTVKGVYAANQEFLPGLFLQSVDGLSLVAVDKNGVVYRKKF